MAFLGSAALRQTSRREGSFRRPGARVVSTKKIVVGGRTPTDVELESVPTDWGPSLTKYRYVYSGDRVMLVDPGSRTVAQEVD
jgi:hypothetical protein